MGRAKAAWLEEQERGYYSIGDKYVCASCFSDYAIAGFIEENCVNDVCSYCGKTGEENIAADINEVMELIVEGLRQEWGDPNDEGMSYESAEGGWLGEVLDSWELLFDRISLGVEDDNLMSDIHESIADKQWCQKNLYGLLPDAELIFDWDQFSRSLKHLSRYVFFRMGENDEGGLQGRTPYLILEDLGKFAIDLNLVQELSKGTKIIRARIHDCSIKFNTIQEMGPPSPQNAIYSNRMSAAGIPMFYGSADQETVIAETYQPNKGKSPCVSLATFTVKQPLKVLDLTKIPDIPSLFDRDRREIRPACIFIQSFLQDITKPIEKDGREHIEYVPTQVVTEYFRHIFKDSDEEKVMGIMYPSAVHDGGISYALFLDSVPPEGQWNPSDFSADKWLSLDGIEVKQIK
jgi:hypothetical protein